MQMIGDALAGGDRQPEPGKFAGDPANAGVDFRVALNQLLQEHLYLASFGDRRRARRPIDEFAAAGGALNTNGTDLGAAIGSLYGDEAKDEFNRIWTAHNGFFVDYTTGVATDDQAMHGQGRQGPDHHLRARVRRVPRRRHRPPGRRPQRAHREHVLTTKAIVDAQARRRAAAAAADRWPASTCR